MSPQGHPSEDGADVVDYVTEIPLPGRTLPLTAKNLARGSVLPSFVAGPENRLVASTFEQLLRSASAQPETAPLPHRLPSVVALFGPSGVGKTHLLQGLVEHWRKQLGAETALYSTAAEFRRDLTEAIDNRRVDEFRQRYRGYRLLAIDDIHRLPPADFVLEELRYTIDALEETDSQIVVASHKAPAILANLPIDVSSRLTAGLLLQLAPPSSEARLRIICQVSASLGKNVSIETADELASSLSGTAPQLIKALYELWTSPPSAATTNTPKTVSASLHARRQPTMHEIIAVVARYTNVPQKQLKSGARQQSIVYARAIAIYLARELAAASYEQIGRALGGRDHTTIMHNYRKIERELPKNLATQETIDDLKRILTTR